MSMPADVLIALAGAAVAAATFVIGRLTAARATGAEWGSLQTDIGYIKSSLQEMKEDVRRLDERLDKHLLRHPPL